MANDPLADAGYSTVRMACTREQVNTKEVEQIAWSVDKYGYDLVTFVCPECQAQHTSHRYE